MNCSIELVYVSQKYVFSQFLRFAFFFFVLQCSTCSPHAKGFGFGFFFFFSSFFIKKNNFIYLDFVFIIRKNLAAD